ncbi:MAG: sensor histidine kinase [Chloroflexi bacterium]|nr:sensor histidine kinase [Chloroflexota bacterium]
MSSDTVPTPNTSSNLNYATVVDRLGEGLLIFKSDGTLILDNATARQILGTNLAVVRQQGWAAFALLVGNEDVSADEIRAKALRQTEPVPFHLKIADAYVPCWAAAIHEEGSNPLIVISIERSDWTPLTELMDNLRKEALPAIEDARGHANFIIQIAERDKKSVTAEQLGQRVVRFAKLISNEMQNLQNFLQKLHRLEVVRTGQMEKTVKLNAKKINLADFVEDFLEEATEQLSNLPDREEEDFRDRLHIDIDDNLNVKASAQQLELVLLDILHNAVLYSPKDAKIQIRAFATNQGRNVQMDIIDEGYGIREREYDRVFTLFQRARQPQVLAEFGYGMSLALAKASIEAMGGRIWFSSEEGVSTTFSIKLPTFQESDNTQDK